MNAKRDQQIGVRFTQRERDIIETYAEYRNITLTDFIRESVFSHIYNLKNSFDKIEISEYIKNINKIHRNSISILESIEKLKEFLKTPRENQIKQSTEVSNKELERCF